MVSGGGFNTANGVAAAVGGGYRNVGASNYSSITGTHNTTVNRQGGGAPPDPSRPLQARLRAGQGDGEKTPAGFRVGPAALSTPARPKAKPR